MKIVRVILLVLLVVVVLTGVGAFALVNDWTRGVLPQHAGEITVMTPPSAQSSDTAGLRDTVEIFRDEWGVPHIYASSTYDLFFAQGYTHAQDRWWQMEFARHIGSGRIQELTGQSDEVMETDIGLRRMGWRRVAEREVAEVYDDESLAILQAFADGVNAYILNRTPNDLAMEYNLLGVNGVSIDIEAWTPADSVVWAKAMAWDLKNDSDEMLRLSIIDALGEDMAADFYPAWPVGEKPTMILPEDLPIGSTSVAIPDMSDTAGIVGLSDDVAMSVPFLEHEEGIGSNNWTVSGELTESGKPLLANDMHLSIQMPSIWYEIGLHCQPVSDECPYNVVGFQFAPAPLVTAGHNDRIAWGFTDHTDDVVDYYLIKVNPDNPLQYEWNGEWRDMTVRDEVIRFGDNDETVTIQVRETHLGPIINDNELDENGQPMGFNNTNPRALHWTALEPASLFKAVSMLNRAQNWDEFREALRLWSVPSQNVVYADVDGNIGMQNPGLIPIRAPGHTGSLPVPGWTDEFEWRGYIPFDNLPRVYNPERGYVATANQLNAPPEYFEQLREALGGEFGEDANYVYSSDWDFGYRAQRIVELLQELSPHNAETFRTIFGDNKNISAEELMPFLAEITFDDSDITNARDWLLEWDYQMHMDSPQAALYANFWVSLIDNLYNDQLGDLPNVSGGGQQMWATHLLVLDPENSWWDDSRTGDVVEARDDILKRAFEQGYASTVQALGTDRANWKWGALHTSTFVSNPLGLSGIDIIENMVNRGPAATSGSTATINAASWSARNGNFQVTSAVSERVIYDTSDWGKSLSMHTTGQSGHPFSPHYANMIDSWRMIEFKPMLWTREQVEAAAVNKLVLTPGN